MQEERYCVTCANWIPTKTGLPQRQVTSPSTTGECHRYAPRALIVAGGETSKKVTAIWPSTRAKDVCGEWYYGGLKLLDEPPGEAETENRAQSATTAFNRGPATPTR